MSEGVDFEKFFKSLHEPAWLTAQRRKSAKLFSAVPMPTRRDEAWKYTEFSGFTFAAPEKIAVTISAPKGVAMAMPHALDDGILKNLLGVDVKDKFALFNAATWTNGYFVHASGDVKEPVVIKHTAAGYASSRSVVVAEPGSRVTVCEIFEGDAPVHYGTLSVIAQDNAHVNVITIQRFSENTWDYARKHGLCMRDATINWTFVLLGGRTSRLNEDTVFAGPGASSELRGVYFGSGEQHFSVITNARHETQNTRSRVETRGVLRDSASSLTRGLIRIEKAARGTDSHLYDRTLHLTSGVRSNAIPSLEIENNDVRASHGASTGKINEEQLFYMASRGLTRSEAEQLIVEGFFEPVVESITVDDVKESVRQLVRKKIETKQAVETRKL